MDRPAILNAVINLTDEGVVPEFDDLVSTIENEISQRVTLKEMLAMASYNNPDSFPLAYPSDFLRMRWVKADGNVLAKISEEAANAGHEGYTMGATGISFSPSNPTTSVELHYVKPIPSLLDSSETRLSQHWPDIYITGIAAAYELRRGNAEKAATYRQIYEGLVERLKSEEATDIWKPASLAVATGP